MTDATNFENNGLVQKFIMLNIDWWKLIWNELFQQDFGSLCF